MEQFLNEAAPLVKLFGGGALALLILRQVLLLMQEWRKGQTEAAARPAGGNGSAGAQNTTYWVDKIQAIVKTLIEDLVVPVLVRLINLLEVVSARLIAMDMEHRAMYEAQMKEHAEAIRQAREIADMVRARHERDARARAVMEVNLGNFQRAITDLTNMTQKLLDRG